MILVLVALAGCGGEERAIVPDAALKAAQAVDCGVAPEWPEIPSIVSTVDENGKPAVLVERPDFERVVWYGRQMQTWSRCMAVK